MRNVIYLVTSPLSKRDYDRFGIETWIERGWNVMVLDFTKFSKPDYWDHIKGDEISYNFEGLNIFSNKKDAYKSLRQLNRKTLFIDFLESNSVGRNIKNYVKKIGPVLRCCLGCYPNAKSSFVGKIKTVLSNPSIVFPYFRC